MAITPSSNLYLLQVPIEIDNANQLTFANATAQHNYFSSLVSEGREDFTYQRKDSIIRYPAHIDSLINFNYVMYQNENYSNKWFYAFIENMTYINDNMTEIQITTDVFQTWQFDLNYKRSFIEREHVNSDGVGEHTIDEGLSTGELVDIQSTLTNFNYGDNFHVAFLMSSPVGLAYSTTSSKGRIYNGIFTGLYTLCMSTGDTIEE